MAKPPARRTGRPTRYQPEIAAEILQRMAGGETLTAICSGPGMPCHSTVRLWAIEDRDGFSAPYARAGEAQAHAIAEGVLDGALSAIGPTALVMAGVPNRAGRALTGHQDDKTYEDHTRGAAQFPLAQQAARELERIFGGMVGAAEAAGNRTKAAGVTGRAAAKARRAALETELETGNSLPIRTRVIA